MKTLQVVLFVVFIVSAVCLENLEDISSDFQQRDFPLNQGEFFSQEDFNEQLKGFDSQFDYKPKPKKYFSSEPKQYVIIKRTHDVPYSKKYNGGHLSSEQISYNKHPPKYGHSVSHKPKTMPVRVVQEGSVKHIYIDMPDVFDDNLSKSKPQQISNSYDNVKQTSSFSNLAYDNFNPVKYEQNYQPPVQYSYSPQNHNANPGFSQGNIEQGFNIASNGYKVGKSNHVNALAQSLEQQFSNGVGSHTHTQPAQYGPQSFGNNEYSSGISQFDTPLKNEYSNPNLGQFNSGNKNEYSSLNLAQFNTEGNNEFSNLNPAQFNTEGKNEYSTLNPAQFSTEGKNEYSTLNPAQFNTEGKNEYSTLNSAQFNTEGKNEYSTLNSAQFNTEGKNEYSTLNPAQLNTENKNVFSHPQFPQYSADGREKYTYEIPDQYKSLFANNAFASTQYGQPEEFKPSFGHQQQDIGKNARMSSVSGFDPNLVNIVNDVFQKRQEYSTPDEFKMIKNGEKSAYLIGKTDTPLDTIPNFGSYSLATNSKGVENSHSENIMKFV